MNELLEQAIDEGPGSESWKQAEQVYSVELLNTRRRLWTGELDPEEVPFWFGGTAHQ